MWRAAPLLLLVAIAAVPAAEPAPPPAPGLPAVGFETAGYLARVAAWDLSVKVPGHRWACTRYLSWHAVPAVHLEKFQRVLRWWLNNLHLEQAVVEPVEVKHSGGRLWRLSIDEGNWNAPSWSAVARRSQAFTDRTVDHRTAEFLRQAVGIRQDPKTLAVEAILWAPHVFADTIESGRSPGYYDLLFANQRFVRPAAKVFKEHHDPKHAGWFSADGGKTWVEKAKIPKDGPPVYADAVDGFVFADFPATAEEWEEFFNGPEEADPKKPVLVTKLAHGSIVAGMTEDPKQGSFVTRQNRFVKIRISKAGGVNSETYDVARATGKRDFLEQAAAIARRGSPEQFDAQEFLSNTPAGGQACLLADGKGKRVEQAVGDIAVGPRRKDCPHLDHPQVRTPLDCVECHARANGLIPPASMLRDAVEGGLDAEFKSSKELAKFRFLFFGWESRLKGYTDPYTALIAATTKGKDGKPWTGNQLADAFAEFANWQRSPLDRKQAAAELGVSPAVFEEAANRAVPGGRAKELVVGRTCPRDPWDADVQPLLQRIMLGDVRPLVGPPKP